MPSYNTIQPTPFLGLGYPLNQIVIFNAEAVTADEFSQQFSIDMGAVGGQKGIRIEGDFNSNPGTFEFDVMERAFDADGKKRNYQQVPFGGSITTTTTGDAGPNTHFGVDLLPFAGPFGLIYVKTAPSNASITCTLRVTRTA